MKYTLLINSDLKSIQIISIRVLNLELNNESSKCVHRNYNIYNLTALRKTIYYRHAILSSINLGAT